MFALLQPPVQYAQATSCYNQTQLASQDVLEDTIWTATVFARHVTQPAELVSTRTNA